MAKTDRIHEALKNYRKSAERERRVRAHAYGWRKIIMLSVAGAHVGGNGDSDFSVDSLDEESGRCIEAIQSR